MGVVGDVKGRQMDETAGIIRIGSEGRWRVRRVLTA